tara:strand:+ start:1210 stop:2499 length:1290 start_codon:yes stop_codon:yes gene_type:complete
MNNIFKKITVIIATIFITVAYSNISVAHEHTANRKLINQLKKEILELGGDPVKKKGLFSKEEYWIGDLQRQLEKLKAETKEAKEKKAAIEAVKKEILKELDALGVKPKGDTSHIDTNEEIIELRKLLEDERKKAEDKKKAEEKKKADEKTKKAKDDALKALKDEIKKEIIKLGEKPITETRELEGDEEIQALKKQLEELKTKTEEKKKAEEKKQARDSVLQNVKKEILFLGETPISEFEITNEDKYIEALKAQLDEIRAIKEQEEKDIQQSIPSWFIKMPKASEKLMYVRGTAVVDTLQGSIDSATNAALRELAKKLETRLNSKVKETVRQAGMGEDQVTKSEMNRVSSIVVKEVTISGYEISETKLVQLDNGNYRSFILLEYPIAHVYKAFVNRIEKSDNLKSSITAIKNTEAFKELEQYISDFSSGA